MEYSGRGRLVPGTCSGWASFFGEGSRILADNLAGERDRWVLWLPVAMGAGVALYFDLLRRAAAAGWASRPWPRPRLLLVLLWRRPALRLLCLGLFVAVLGFAAAELRTATVEAPMLAERLKGVEVQGRVREVEFLPTGRRLRLDEVTIEGVAAPPAQIRLKLALDYPLLVPGDRVRMRRRWPRPRGPWRRAPTISAAICSSTASAPSASAMAASG